MGFNFFPVMGNIAKTSMEVWKLHMGNRPTNNGYNFEVKIMELCKLPIVALFRIAEIWLIFDVVLHIGCCFYKKCCVYCIY